MDLVDLVEGVEFYVPRDMDYDDPYQDLHIHLKEGRQVLDGEKAMQLVRFRGYDDGDIGRVAVQQDFLKALIKECLSLKHWGKIKAYIDLGGHQIQINAINRERLLDAQAHPENYPNLIVRVWGWSGYFCELDKVYQDHIIQRVEFGV